MEKTLLLSNGQQIPVLGLGTWQLTGDLCTKAVEKALEIGYRHIDTAERYENHNAIGQALLQSGIPRKELFLVSKVWREHLERSAVLDACKRILEELKTNYLDLCLIHWPNGAVPIQETLLSLQDLKEQGLIKGIGVSNFTIHHLQDALKTDIEIALNQIEFHPTFQQTEIKAFCDSHRIAITAYSPLGRGQDIQLQEIQNLAKKYARSPAQVILNWIVSKGMVAIPKSYEPAELEDNYRTLEWSLEKNDIVLIDQLDRKNRLVAPPFHEFDY
jgi:diketogulonate reductase-like aldo/keto reductase